jgi:hypothetical protein
MPYKMAALRWDQIISDRALPTAFRSNFGLDNEKELLSALAEGPALVYQQPDRQASTGQPVKRGSTT